MNISHINPTPMSPETRRPMMMGQILLEMGKLTNAELVKTSLGGYSNAHGKCPSG